MDFGVSRSFVGNRLTLLSKRIPGVRSVSMGFWIDRGGRDEAAATMGISHFYEHMIFKGTRRRSMADIARTLEKRGGALNAFTGKEQVCIHARFVDDDLPLAADLIKDLFQEPLFLESELSKERLVVLEEIRAAEDDPEDSAQDLLVRCLWPEQPMGFPIAGTGKTVRHFRRRHLIEALRRAHASRLVVSAAGNVRHADLRRLFSDLGGGALPRRRALRLRPARALRRYVGKPVQQANVCLGFKTGPFASPERAALMVLNALLGDSMSSRLFQSIREKLGLAYSVFSFLDAYYDTGMLGIFFATEGDRMREALAAVLSELREVSAGRFTAQELAFAKSYLRGNILLGLESSAGQMFNLARSQMYLGRVPDAGVTVREIEKVTAGALRSAARKYFRDGNLSMAVVGPAGLWSAKDLGKIHLDPP